MTPIRYLVDTSIWVNHFRGDATTKLRLAELASRPGQIVMCEIVAMELLAGSRRREDQQVLDLLNKLPSITINPLIDFRIAGILFQDLVRNGVTIRNSVDCLIAVAAKSDDDIVLVHDDLDFVNMARFTDLKHERWNLAA